MLKKTDDLVLESVPKAAMGWQIVNGEAQLGGGKFVVNTKLATLHFGAK